MCGIFAALSLKEPFNRSDFKIFKDATDLVTHRGPDAADYRVFNFNDELNTESFNLFFGHRRLSIIDLSADGNQPMEDDGVTIIYNGEIFNYVELREELIRKNVAFRTKSDTEVILKIYKHYGPESFDKLNGMWAFILYDSRKKLLVASRDRFSIKPLFWTQTGNKIYFASEIKQLVKIMPSKSINKKIMSLFLLQGVLDINDKTFIEGVNKIEPKHNFFINLMNGEKIQKKYWDYRYIEIPENNVSEMFLDLLYSSIKIRLRSDVNLGALLSGGLDSSAICIIGQELAVKEFKTYTVISDKKEYSEEKFADVVINEKGIQNEKLLISGDSIRNNFDAVLKCQDEPFINFIVMAHYTMLEKIKKESDITVILSGQGGDEVLMGYLRFFFLYLKNLYSKKQYLMLIKEILASLIFRTVLMQWQISAAKRYLPKMLKEDKNFLMVNTKLENTWDSSDLINTQINDIDHYSVPILTRYEDRNSMAHSLEIRLPFLDHRLVEFLLSLKVELKIKNGWNKYILRKSFVDMPKKIRWRRDKKGFSLPESVWLKEEFKSDIFNSFLKSKLEDEGILSGTKFIDYYKEFLNGNKRIHNFDISRVYIAEKWAKNFFN